MDGMNDGIPRRASIDRVNSGRKADTSCGWSLCLKRLDKLKSSKLCLPSWNQRKQINWNGDDQEPESGSFTGECGISCWPSRISCIMEREERRGDERSVHNHVTRAVFNLSVDTVRFLQVNLPCIVMTWTVPYTEKM